MSNEEPKKEVEVTFGGSERKPGDKVQEHIADIRSILNELFQKVEAQFSGMADDDKQILEEKLAALRSGLQKVSDEFGDIEK